jgi:DMSO/TMAO reductase YedYZ molybdopterin-dependent catalytic subunit
MSNPRHSPGTGWQSTGARLAAVSVSLFLAMAGPSRAADPVASPGSAVAVEASGVSVDGLVRHALRLSADDLRKLPPTRLDVSFVTGHGEEKASYTGVLLWTLLDRAGGLGDTGKRDDLRHTMIITGRDGYVIAMSLGEIDPDFGDKSVILAYARDEQPMGARDGLRLIVPGDKHGGRNVRDVVRIEIK